MLLIFHSKQSYFIIFHNTASFFLQLILTWNIPDGLKPDQKYLLLVSSVISLLSILSELDSTVPTNINISRSNVISLVVLLVVAFISSVFSDGFVPLLHKDKFKKIFFIVERKLYFLLFIAVWKKNQSSILINAGNICCICWFGCSDNWYWTLSGCC